jgi:hypothetical protein
MYKYEGCDDENKRIMDSEKFVNSQKQDDDDDDTWVPVC